MKDLILKRFNYLDTSTFQVIYHQAHGENASQRDLIKSIKSLGDVQAKFKIEHNAYVCFDFKENHRPSEVFNSQLITALTALKPWRKGPFKINNITLDAEWASDLKWNQIIKHFDLNQKRVLDIGANNGYYMFRGLEHNPKWIFGIDPTFKYSAQFSLLNQWALDDRLMFARFKHQQLDLFPKQFDVILCLGIIYHTTDPIALLKNIHASLDKGGIMILESQGIEGNQPYALIPRGKYAGAKGMWYIPTAPALINWIKRAGFRHVELFHSHILTSQEQRKTEWVEGPSLCNFIDPNDHTQTVEGYPAPIRMCLRAYK